MQRYAIGLDIVADDDTIAVSGELDAHNVTALEDVVRTWLDDGGGAPVRLDLADVSFVDFGAVERLLAVRDEAARRPADVTIATMSPAVARVVSLLELVDALDAASPSVDAHSPPD